ncbi:O-antigen ligase family protein [Candidatus Uhrbacteria bacterium]|nr:O-antigen ligase family protein [Candidatus Uhrbacteria bacterium]
MIASFANLLFLCSIFFLSWQTQWIIGSVSISGQASSYGVFSVYVVEVFILFAFLLRLRQQTSPMVLHSWKTLSFFLAMVFFSLSFSHFTQIGWFQAIHVVSASMLYFLITDQRTNIKQVLSLFLLGLMVPVALGWFQVIRGSSPDSTTLGIAAKDVFTPGVAVVETLAGRLMRAYGTFPHPNIFGGYLAFAVIALGYLSLRLKKHEWVMGLVGAAVFGATLVTTFSRSAWLGLFIGCLVLIALMFWQKKIPPRRALPILMIGLASVLSTLILFHNQVFSRVYPTGRIEVISIEERASQYQTVDDVFLSAPFFGVGPNAYTFVLSQRDPGHPAWSYQPVHNTFLLILAELGLVGILFFGYFIFSVNPIAHASVRKPDGMFAVMIGVTFFVIALFDHYLWSLWSGLALSALACAVMVRWERDK